MHWRVPVRSPWSNGLHPEYPWKGCGKCLFPALLRLGGPLRIGGGWGWRNTWNETYNLQLCIHKISIKSQISRSQGKTLFFFSYLFIKLYWDVKKKNHNWILRRKKGEKPAVRWLFSGRINAVGWVQHGSCLSGSLLTWLRWDSSCSHLAKYW